MKPSLATLAILAATTTALATSACYGGRCPSEVIGASMLATLTGDVAPDEAQTLLHDVASNSRFVPYQPAFDVLTRVLIDGTGPPDDAVYARMSAARLEITIAVRGGLAEGDTLVLGDLFESPTRDLDFGRDGLQLLGPVQLPPGVDVAVDAIRYGELVLMPNGLLQHEKLFVQGAAGTLTVRSVAPLVLDADMTLEHESDKTILVQGTIRFSYSYQEPYCS